MLRNNLSALGPVQPNQGGIEFVVQSKTAAQENQVLLTSHRVDDIHKAEAMAYASDTFRTNAAQLRHVSKMAVESEAILEDVNEKTAPSHLRPLARRKHASSRQRQLQTYSALRQAYRDVDSPLFEKIYEERAQETSPGEATRFANTSSDKLSQVFDERADQIEEIAGVLHDHPVSQAYREKHPEVDVTPEGLFLRKEQMERTQAKAKLYRERLQRTEWDSPEEYYDEDGEYDGTTGYGALQGLLMDIMDINEEKAADKENEAYLLKRIGARDKLNDFYRALCNETYIQPLEDEVAQSQGVFDDVQRDIQAELPGLSIQTTSPTK